VREPHVRSSSPSPRRHRKSANAVTASVFCAFLTQNRSASSSTLCAPPFSARVSAVYRFRFQTITHTCAGHSPQCLLSADGQDQGRATGLRTARNLEIPIGIIPGKRLLSRQSPKGEPGRRRAVALASVVNLLEGTGHETEVALMSVANPLGGIGREIAAVRTSVESPLAGVGHETIAVQANEVVGTTTNLIAKTVRILVMMTAQGLIVETTANLIIDTATALVVGIAQSLFADTAPDLVIVTAPSRDLHETSGILDRDRAEIGNLVVETIHIHTHEVVPVLVTVPVLGHAPVRALDVGVLHHYLRLDLQRNRETAPILGLGPGLGQALHAAI
jgi:hypothetical protein